MWRLPGYFTKNSFTNWSVEGECIVEVSRTTGFPAIPAIAPAIILSKFSKLVTSLYWLPLFCIGWRRRVGSYKSKTEA